MQVKAAQPLVSVMIQRAVILWEFRDYSATKSQSLRITLTISLKQSQSPVRSQERSGRRNHVTREPQHVSNLIFVVNDPIGGGQMKGVALGAIIETEVEIIVLKIIILIRLREEEIEAISKDQIVQGVQAPALIVANVVDAVD